jgi:hypothetical protein
MTAASTDTDDLKQAKAATLVENTAQAIFKHLDRLEDHRKSFESRWVWELLQNARDARTPRGVSIAITLQNDELEFCHDGAPFTPGEISHLIYHGSTKVEEADLDHFGSGFLSTHLLSRTVRVSGELTDNRTFEFDLDRSGATVAELGEAMNRSWDEFEASCVRHPPNGGKSTTYVYRLADHALATAREGLASLRKIGPLVLAFSPEIASLAIHTDGEDWSAARGERQPLTESVELLQIACKDNNTPSLMPIAIATAASDEVQVVLPLGGTDGLTVTLGDDVPRIFVLFPLVTTERLPLPTVVNSKLFKPEEDRNGLRLSGESERISQNKALLEIAAGLTLQLLTCAADRKWGGLEQIVNFDSTHLPDWVDREWFEKYLTGLMEQTRRIAMLTNAGDGWITPARSWIPCDTDEQNREALWELAAACEGGGDALPKKEHAHVWYRNLRSWQALKPDAEFDETFTVARLAALVDDLGSVERLNSHLGDRADAFDWVSGLLKLVAAGESSLLDHYRLLPSETGMLKQRSDLRHDSGISEDLKTIGESFGVLLRDGLLDSRAATPEIIGLLQAKTEDEALQEVIEGLDQKREDEWLPVEMVGADVALFGWVAQSAPHRHRLDGFRVATADESDGRTRLIELKRDLDRAPLAPPSVWPENAQPYASLFPRRKTLHASAAADDLNLTSEDWTVLGLDGFVRLAPLFATTRRLDGLLAPDLHEGDETVSHESRDDVPASDIAFLTETKDGGVIDSVRNSRPRAMQLVEFITNYVLEEDDAAFEEIEIACACGETHRAFSAAWLRPLFRRRWIPLSSTQSARATAESLAALLADKPQVLEQLADKKGNELLRALQISPADFQLRAVTADEQQRVALVRSIGDLARAAGGDIQRVEMLVGEIRDHPEIIDSIEKRKEDRAMRELNQRVGALVEKLFDEELTAQGLKVRRTGVGSDFKVKGDVTEGDEEVWLEVGDDRTWILVEIKSTRSDRARMTPTQAAKACERRRTFALCVVPLPDDSPTRETVREQCRFVFDIGELLEGPVADYESIRNATYEARQHRGDIDVEITDGQTRFAVGPAIWMDGLQLEDAIAEIEARIPRGSENAS